MILAQVLASSASIMVAGTSGTQVGYSDGAYGTLYRSPVGIRALGSEIGVFYFNAGGGGFVVITMTGDQRTPLTGKSIFVDATEFAFDDAASSSFGSGVTQYSWTGVSSPFVNGSKYRLTVA